MADVEMNTVCEQFLMKGPFKGSVPVFKDKDDVKDLCRGEGPMGWKSVKWDAENKLWGTMEVGNIPRLLASGKWRPLGIQESWYGCLAQMAKAKSYFQAKVKTEKQEGKLAATAEQNEKERGAALEERKRREAEQQERTKLSLTARNSATPLALVSSKIVMGMTSPAYSKPKYSSSFFL